MIAPTVQDLLAQQPRVPLANLPTPLQPLPNLSDQLGIDLWVKRDDLTGLALGGNKARKLEYVLADAVRRGADTIITTGSTQSNHARMTAAAARMLGMECYLVLGRGRHVTGGNMLLDTILGAHIEVLAAADSELTAVPDRVRELGDELRNARRKPYIVPLGASTPAGCLGYVRAVVELSEQFREQDLRPDYIYVVAGSIGTQAGILAGVTALEMPASVQGVSVSAPREPLEEIVVNLTNDTFRYLGLDRAITGDDAHVDDSQIGEGYGKPTPALWEALRLAAQSDGLLLDPVYTGKAMAGLIDHARRGILPRGSTVIFMHTGGIPALFAYGDEVSRGVKK